MANEDFQNGFSIGLTARAFTKKQGGEGEEGLSVQVDYLQNDPSAADYIKNRPFYKEKDGESFLLGLSNGSTQPIQLELSMGETYDVVFIFPDGTEITKTLDVISSDLLEVAIPIPQPALFINDMINGYGVGFGLITNVSEDRDKNPIINKESLYYVLVSEVENLKVKITTKGVYHRIDPVFLPDVITPAVKNYIDEQIEALRQELQGS